MIDAGKLRHRIQLQSRTETQDATTGAVVVTWATQATVWASIEPLSAREFMQSAGTQAQVSARIVIRHRSDVDTSWRVLHGSSVYSVHGVLPDKDSGLEYLTMVVSLGVGNGE